MVSVSGIKKHPTGSREGARVMIICIPYGRRQLRARPLPQVVLFRSHVTVTACQESRAEKIPTDAQQYDTYFRTVFLQLSAFVYTLLGLALMSCFLDKVLPEFILFSDLRTVLFPGAPLLQNKKMA
jgi:hypothetical protein